MSKNIEDYFKIKYTFHGRRYGVSTSAAKSRLKCYLTHIPFTRKFVHKWHDLDCGSLIICGLDDVVFDESEIVQAMMDDPAFNVKLKRAKPEAEQSIK